MQDALRVVPSPISREDERVADLVTLVRHAFPLVDPAVPPESWPLSDAGLEAARELSLPPDSGEVRYASSPELKAVQTLRSAVRAGANLVVDPRFREVDRIEAFRSDVRAHRRLWISGAIHERHEGWESLREAGMRFYAGAAAYPGHLVVATHGMVLTAWLVRIGAVEAGEEAARFWEELRFPDVLTVDVRARCFT